MKYLIEHLEPKLYKWSMLEYEHISKTVGKQNLIFTNIKTKKQKERLSKLGKAYHKSVCELCNKEFKNKRLCLLDPAAEETLNPKDAKKFDIFVFGGILGDNPPQERTKKELGLSISKSRNLGKIQMPTDNAVYVVKKIVSGTKINKIDYVDKLDINIQEGESIILPFRYVIHKGHPLVSKKLVDYLKKKRGF